MRGLVVDLFAGGGGASTGIEAALRRPVDIAINHSATAIAVHKANHRGTTHYTSDVFEVDPLEATQGRPVELLWASPDCTHFSRAKGSRPDRPRSKKIRSLAWVVVRWARAVRPRVICLENVEEFLTWGPLGRDGQPVKAKQGRTFRAWRDALVRLGYHVEHQVLDASRYGAPTRRKRLFVVARNDGMPIAWPEPTHGPGLRPYRTAGECIDWAIPTRSIFGRKKPLAEKTMQRIAEGIRRFVLENPRPYIVQVSNSGTTGRAPHVWPEDQPLRTVTSVNGFAAVAPVIVPTNHGGGEDRAHSADEPSPTVTASRRSHAVVAPYMVETRNGEREGQRPRVRSAEQPHGTITAKGSQGAIVAPLLVEPGQRHGRGQKAADAPLSTIVAKDRHAVAAPVLVKFRHDSPGGTLADPMPTITSGGSAGGRPAGAAHALGVAEVGLIDMQRNNAPRALDDPLGVVTTQHNRFNLLGAAFVAKHFGGVVGQHPGEPIGTVTSRDHHGPVAAALLKFRGDPKDHPGGAPLDEPMPTITAGGLHLAECRAFLTKWYSSRGERGADLFEPAPTATAKARFGLVIVDGVEYEIADIYLRMLEPEELLRAQFGEFAEAYDLSAATTKEAKTRLIGNSVCPHVAAALVRANVRVDGSEVAA